MKSFRIINVLVLIAVLVLVGIVSAQAAFAASATNQNSNLVVGSFTATGSSKSISIGWTPKVVVLSSPSTTNPVIIKWNSSMTAGYGMKTLYTASTASTVVSLATVSCIRSYAGAAPMSALTGTVTITSGSALLTGSGTAFTTELAVGDIVSISGQSFQIAYISSSTSAVATTLATSTATVTKFYSESGRSPGFTIGADTDLNISGDTVYYEAYR